MKQNRSKIVSSSTFFGCERSVSGAYSMGLNGALPGADSRAARSSAARVEQE